MLALFTMAGCGAARSSGTQALVTWNRPRTLTANTRSQSAMASRASRSSPAGTSPMVTAGVIDQRHRACRTRPGRRPPCAARPLRRRRSARREWPWRRGHAPRRRPAAPRCDAGRVVDHHVVALIGEREKVRLRRPIPRLAPVTSATGRSVTVPARPAAARAPAAALAWKTLFMTSSLKPELVPLPRSSSHQRQARIIGSEHDLVLQSPADVGAQARREVLQGPAGKLPIDVALVQRDRGHFVNPGPAGMGGDDGQLGGRWPLAGRAPAGAPA